MQKRDLTEEIANTVANREGIEFVSLQLHDAFDPAWWEKVGAVPSLSGVGVDLTNEGMLCLITSYNSSIIDQTNFIRSTTIATVRRIVDAISTGCATLFHLISSYSNINTLSRSSPDASSSVTHSQFTGLFALASGHIPH